MHGALPRVLDGREHGGLLSMARVDELEDFESYPGTNMIVPPGRHIEQRFRGQGNTDLTVSRRGKELVRTERRSPVRFLPLVSSVPRIWAAEGESVPQIAQKISRTEGGTGLFCGPFCAPLWLDGARGHDVASFLWTRSFSDFCPFTSPRICLRPSSARHRTFRFGGLVAYNG